MHLQLPRCTLELVQNEGIESDAYEYRAIKVPGLWTILSQADISRGDFLKVCEE